MFCPECGQQNADDNKFCMKCGKKIVTEKIVSSSEAIEKPVTQAFQDEGQACSLPSADATTHINTELKDSGTVTAMSVVGLVFGLIGMLGSFIPCLGSFAFYIALPAAIASGIALGMAYSQKAKKTFAIVALTISLIGVVISGWQLYSIASLGQSVIRESRKFDLPANKEKHIPPMSTPSLYNALVTKREASFTFPIPDKKVWKFGVGGLFEIIINNNGQKFKIGAYDFPASGTNIIEEVDFRGWLEKSQKCVWKIENDGGESLMQEIPVLHTIKENDNIFTIGLIRDIDVQALLSNKPKYCMFNVDTDIKKEKKEIAINYE